MNEYQAVALIGLVTRKLHLFELTPEAGARMLAPVLGDAVNEGMIEARITTAIRANHEALRTAQNRNADLMKLRELLKVSAVGTAKGGR